MLAQTTLRAVLGQHELDEMLSERKKLSADVQSILDAATETWGIKVSNVDIWKVELTDNMVRAIAKQAEAERDRRAKIIHADPEFQASQTLVNAAKILGSVPAAMQFAAVVDRMLWRLICPGFGLGVALQGIGYGPAVENPN